VDSARWFIGFGFDAIMELISFVIAFAVAYQAFKGYRLTRERTFLYLQFSFVLLAAGLLVDGLSTIFVLLARTGARLLGVSSLGYTIFFFAQLTAYLILVCAYLQKTRTLAAESLALSILPVLPVLGYTPTGELILIFLLFFITAQTLINYSVRRTSGSLLVMFAFTMLTLSHAFFLLMLFDARLFVLAHVAQLSGFVLLLVMLLQVNRSA